VTLRDPFDLVREWFAAYNRGDLAALGSYYGEAASLEHEDGRSDGRESIGAAWLARFTAWGPGFEGGVRRRLRMVGLVENGLVHAEWLEREADGTGTVRERRGYSDFQVERGAVLSQHDVFYEGSAEPEIIAGAPPLPPRKYPPRPVVGIGAVIVHDDRVVLIKRKYEPLAGQWSLPGGTLELGESLEAGVAREIHEETGLDEADGTTRQIAAHPWVKNAEYAINTDAGEGILLVRLGGTCHGCAASTITLKQGIESRLRAMVPEVRHVEAV